MDAIDSKMEHHIDSQPTRVSSRKRLNMSLFAVHNCLIRANLRYNKSIHKNTKNKHRDPQQR